MSRRAVVFGAAGQLGIELVRELQKRRFAVMSWDRTQVDITDAVAVQKALADFDAEVVFNSAAYNQVDVAEKEPQAAFLINGLAVRNLALACRQMDAQLVHFSTDYVFDGTKTGWYVESDPVMPLGVYGSSKAEGERLALQYEGSTVLRTAWLFGALGQNFVTTMLRLARERPSIGVVADQHGCPTAAKDVAVALVSVAQACLDGTIDGGLFHLTSPVPATWHEFAAAIFNASRHGFHGEFRKLTTAEYPTRARRPANSRLDSSLIEKKLGIRLPDWHNSVIDVVRELETGANRSH